MKTPNTIYNNATVTRERCNQLNDHKSVVIWFTGLSGSGKSTLAHLVEEELYTLDCRTFVLDGDYVYRWLHERQDVGYLVYESDFVKGNLSLSELLKELVSNYSAVSQSSYIFVTGRHGINDVLRKLLVMIDETSLLWGDVGSIRNIGRISRIRNHFKCGIKL